MRHSDRLDAQLSARLRAGTEASKDVPAPTADTLAQLMAADLLAQWRTAIPRAQYADSLEARLLAHAMTAHAGAKRVAASAPDGEVAGLTESSATSDHAALAWSRGRGGRGSTQQRRLNRSAVSYIPALRSLVAAALLLLALGVAVVVAAAHAAPGSALYGLHRIEQDVRVSLASSPSERVRLRLAYAQTDLAAIDRALAQHDTGGGYVDALAAFQSDFQAIGKDMPAVPAGAERDSLVAQVATLETQGRTDLLQGLPALSWSARVKTTAVLGSLGVVTPTVTKATITRAVGPGGRHITIVVEGSNFQQGAVVVVNGEVVGGVVSETSTQLVAQVDLASPIAGAKTVGVSNPDGTAAETAEVAVVVDAGNGNGAAGGNNATPAPTASASPGNGGGNGNGNGSGHPGGGGSHGTPTPSR